MRGCVFGCEYLHACNLANPACDAPPYYFRPLWLHHIFRHYLIKGTIFGKRVTEHKMCVLIFSTTFIYNISHPKKNLARYWHKSENIFMQSIRYSRRILMKLEIFRHNFEKNSNMKCHQTRSSGSRVAPCGRTDTMELLAILRKCLKTA